MSVSKERPPLGQDRGSAKVAGRLRDVRPEYRQEDVQHIFTAAGFRKGDVIVELGPGDGGLTQVLLQHPDVEKIYCVEPDSGRRDELKAHLAHEVEAGKVVVVEGCAEEPNLPENLQAGLIVGADVAHHIKDPQRATVALMHTLAPGGKIALIARYPDHHDAIMSKLDDLLREHCERYRNKYPVRRGESDAVGDTTLGRHLIAEEGAACSSAPLRQILSREQLFSDLASRDGTAAYCIPPLMEHETEADAGYRERCSVQKIKVFEDVIEPLFAYARVQGVAEKGQGEEKIPLPRVQHIMVGNVREYGRAAQPETAAMAPRITPAGTKGEMLGGGGGNG